MSTIKIPQGEHGRIRVFSISRPRAEIEAELAAGSKHALASRLLGREISKDAFELFDVGDLTGVGLPHYLIEGQAIPQDQVAPDRSKLDALEGFVLLLLSRTFDGKAAVLETDPDLTLIGTYGESTPDMRQTALPSKAARPYSGESTPPPPTPSKPVPGRTMVIVGILVVLLLLLWWLL